MHRSSKWSLSLRSPYKHPARTTCVPHTNHTVYQFNSSWLDFPNNIGEEYGSQSSLFHRPLHSQYLAPLRPKILSTLLLNSLRLHSSHNMRDQISHPYKTSKISYNMHSPCINSNNLLTTVFRNFQCARRNLGYCPTTYMMLDAIIALLSLPFFCSQRPSKSLITVTRNLFSSSSCMAPDMLPMAQQSCLQKVYIILL